MKKWLHTHTLHIKQCLTQEKTRLKTHTHDIRNWMRPKPNKSAPQDIDNTQSTTTHIKNTQASIMKLFRKTSKQIRPQSYESSSKQTKAVHKPNKVKTLYSTSFIQTILKLKRKPKNTPEAAATTKIVQT